MFGKALAKGWCSCCVTSEGGKLVLVNGHDLDDQDLTVVMETGQVLIVNKLAADKAMNFTDLPLGVWQLSNDVTGVLRIGYFLFTNRNWD